MNWVRKQSGMLELHSRGNIDAYVFHKCGSWVGWIDDFRPVGEMETFQDEASAKLWCRKTVMDRRKRTVVRRGEG